jgi:hypothetical protein
VGEYAIYNQLMLIALLNARCIRQSFSLISVVAFFSLSVCAQGKRFWVLRAPGEVVEYDPTTLAQKQMVKVPPEILESPQNLLINPSGQMLFASPVALPLAEGDVANNRKVWFWDGHVASTLTRDVSRTTGTAGSNLSITESAPVPYLAQDGKHLYWFANQARRLQRDGVDLSTKTRWQAWQTDLSGANRQDLADVSLPECSCPTGGCEESCPYGNVWVPDDGVGKFFLLMQFVAGKTQPVYKSTAVYQEHNGKWDETPLDSSLHRVLDAVNAKAIVEAIPDTGCCGWANQSDDQTLVHLGGRTIAVFDELAAFNNPDYDVSFYTENARLSPDASQIAFTIVATSKPNTPIQLAEQGQANPEESLRIRKALLNLPEIEVKNTQDLSRRPISVPHATLVGWIREKEILIVEDHMLVEYNVATGARRKSSIRVEDAAHVFLR